MPTSALTGTRIRERRLVLGLRQAELAREVGISPAYLNLIEHNRRRIGGKLLVDLARKLDVEASALTEGAEAALLEALREATARHSASATPELPRIEEFVGRFPGWAQLLADTHRRVNELERTVEMLTDRLAHDPFLSTSLHEVMSTVTAIRSSAAILAETRDIDPEWQARFLRNINDESRRLTEGAQSLVSYLDDSGAETETRSLPQEEVESILKARAFHMTELEAGPADIDALIGTLGELTLPGRDLMRRYLVRYARDAAQMPLAPFAEAATQAPLDPGQLAQRFGVDPAAVLRRLASLPEAYGLMAGLVICDGSGTLTFRKPVAGFPLPRFGAACALWPLYQALSRPVAPVCALVEQSGRSSRRFQAYAICQPVGATGFSEPQVLEATMLVLPPPDPQEGDAPLRIGTSCRICPRRTCPARREPSILDDGF